MRSHLHFPGRSPSLRSFITVTISLIVAVVLLCSVSFYYNRTAALLGSSSQESIIRQLTQVNETITAQIDSIDSVIPLFLSNNLIASALERPSFAGSTENQQFQVERQMSYIYSSTPLSSRNFTNSIYIISDDGTVYHTYTSGNLEDTAGKSEELLRYASREETRLMCFTLPSDPDNIYFGRNLYNSSTGGHMGLILLNIHAGKWMDYCARGVDPAWFISLYRPGISLLSDARMAAENKELTAQAAPSGQSIDFQELTLNGADYYVASQLLSGPELTSAVAAPKELLLRKLNRTLRDYLFLLGGTIIIALLAAVIISRAVTRPINRMVFHINEISRGKLSTLPPMKMYHEFDVWAEAFNKMLKQLDIYYNDNFQKQLLLKNAEIQALQSQMDPHFLFNVLNTIAWKAQMTDNEEIYQMVISLGELLKMNAMSKEQAFIPLEKEMEYVRFYIYLQQMRFEDKISCSIQIPPGLNQCRIPCFCIQPLVENAIVHGLEPKKGRGKLAVQIIERGDGQMEICIVDNGVGFSEIPDVKKIASASGESHLHLGLKNLDKRLELLFGEAARLKIASTPGVCTSVSFLIPIQKEELS